jgi:pyrimidine and pyridine-specific 5'-nucleotidase
MLQWFAAKGGQMTCATKNLIIHLQWFEDAPLATVVEEPLPASPIGGRQSLPSPVISSRRSSLAFRPEGSPTTPTTPLKSPGQINGSNRPSISHRGSSLKAPRDYDVMAVKPRIIAVLDTPDVAVGAVDPQKRRVATSTRFSSRLGADRRIFVSTFTDRDISQLPPTADETSQTVGFSSGSDDSVTPIVGAWSALADEPSESEDGFRASPSIPSGFKGLATPGMNPMVMTLTHEEVVVGCTDGTIYSMSFVGYGYKSQPKTPSDEEYEQDYSE